ncbi:nucleolar transcription factor 1-like [Lycodopsis pacificus]
MAESGNEVSGWTRENLQKLLAVMKTSIPENDRKHAYTRGMKNMDWSKVAFPPFSPEACKEKWGQILQKMVKTRTLTELLVEAEGVISNPGKNMMSHPEHPKKPAPPNAIFLEENRAKYIKKHPSMSRQKVFKNLVKKYQMLPDEEKAQYVEKFQLANKKYKRRMEVFSKQYTSLKYNTNRKRLSANTEAVKKVIEETEGMPLQPPLSGYRLYCKEQHTSEKGSIGSNSIYMLAQGWRDMTEEQQMTFNRRSAELNRRYHVQLNKYLMNFDTEKQQQILKESGIKRPEKSTGIKRKDKIPGEPKMPSQSGSGVFFKKKMLLLKEKIPNVRDRFAMANKMWADLSAVQKQVYRKGVLEAIRKYPGKLQKWFEKLLAEEQQLYRTCNPSKIKYLDVSQMVIRDIEEPRGAIYIPSDSEDEDAIDSSEEEESDAECDEVEEEEDRESIAFNMY